MSNKTLTATNPANDNVLNEYATLSKDDLARKLDQTRESYPAYSQLPLEERARRLNVLADLIDEHKEEMATLIAREMGKPYQQGLSETQISSSITRFYADNLDELMDPEPRDVEGAESAMIIKDPMGAVLGVMPWNYPLYQVVRFAAPNLAGGNVCLLKHASNVPGCAELITQLFHKAGFEEGVFTWLPIGAEMVESIINDPIVCGVTLTGSEEAGRKVAQQAGAALKPSVLELGGIDPLIVLDDAEIERAVDLAIAGRFDNTGQSCAASKRLIVDKSLAKDFTARLIEKVKQMRMDDPLVEGIDIGPMSRKDLRDDLHDQVQRAIKAGAKLECGGEIPDRAGAWYPPTVLSNVTQGNPAFNEELFGPVASVVIAENEDHAIQLANDCPYGLGSTVVSKDLERGERVARQLEAGMSFVNRPTTPFAQLPFGGVKGSGYGREQSEYGFGAFMNIRTVYVAKH
ncbi:NAD-dependent succinate-semialdehyde dehydrogenase [Cobetia sp. QF-1]|uniref:NAD-dependent succinate-semialdehyde dehydrogenase n=1 Tax=Cobetia sp. QF-1 TaxID=1969833 RepID=UPI000B54099E|nr:NAD-dependent succinate-semialdehyde dehydrogenase [Cobetia sp. QF-1]